jgi:predicted MFS family arabinose efflux permease
VTVGIVVAWGLALLPFGFDVPTAVTIACFTIGGAIYGPFVALSVTLMQAKSPPQHLAAMLAARSAVLLTASPLGTALGGPLTTALGARDARRLRTRHRGARRRRVRPVAGPT